MMRQSIRSRTFCLTYLYLIVGVAGGWKQKNKKDLSSTECDVFLAPSSDFGWGVYAARDFQESELVEIIPAYLPLPTQGVEIQSSILLDYVHTTGCGSTDEEKDQLLLGHGSSYNHNDNPNIQFVEYTHGATGHVMAVQAIRNVSVGEELLARYGEDDWFTSRNIPQKKDHAGLTIPQIDLSYYKSQYCSKIQAGVGSKTWNETILPNIPIHNFRFDAIHRLAPNDAGFGVTRAKYDMVSGDRIELSLGLLVSQRIMTDSIVAPLLFPWKDLTTEQQRTMRMLRKNFKDQFVLHYPGGRQERYDAFASYEDLAILPIGALGLVRRMGGDISNCRLKIRESMPAGSTSLGLELIATKSIRKGQVLLLQMPPSGTSQELALLEQELKRTGQPYHASTFAVASIREEL